MKPKSQTGGLEVLTVIFDDGVIANLIPFGITEKPNGFQFKASAAGTNEFYQLIVREVEMEKGKLAWQGIDNKKYGIEFSRTNLSEAASMRPFSGISGPSTCYIQSQIPELAELINKANNNDMEVTCRQPGILGYSADSPAACKMVHTDAVPSENDWDCPPATFCVGDPSVTHVDGQAKLGD